MPNFFSKPSDWIIFKSPKHLLWWIPIVFTFEACSAIISWERGDARKKAEEKTYRAFRKGYITLKQAQEWNRNRRWYHTMNFSARLYWKDWAFFETKWGEPRFGF